VLDPIFYTKGIAGLVLLVAGAEVMVRGAGNIAARFGISLKSSLAGQADIALGNVVGSNILNILLILGLSAMITPLVVDNKMIRREVPILLIVSFLLFIAALNQKLSVLEGAILFAGSIAFTVFAIWDARRSPESATDEDGSDAQQNPLFSLALVLVGIAMLVIGANWLVDTAVQLARVFGVSELLIGLTVVSIGTSLPELATSLMAAAKGFRDMAVGNVIGSCLFNVLAVTGAAAIFSADGLNVSEALIRFDMPVMLAATVACLPIFATGHSIDRWEGFLFFAFYIAYTSYLVMVSHSAESVEIMTIAMLSFVLPLTFITLLLLWLREIRGNRT